MRLDSTPPWARANVLVHLALGPVLFCEDRPTPHAARELPGDLVATCPVCFRPGANPPGSALIVKERVR